MNQQPDKLFREKLAGLQKPVSSAAWSRVDATLQKKTNWRLWANIAASTIIVAVAAYVLWPANTSVNQNTKQLSGSNQKGEIRQTPALNDSTVREQEQTAEETTIAQLKNEGQTNGLEKKTERVRKSQPFIAVTESEHTVLPEPQQTNPDQIAKQDNNEVIEIVAIEPSTTSEEPVSKSETQQEDVGVTIVYSAEEVNQKYLDKKYLDEATSDNSKPSTLRKLLKKAQDLKINQDAFGDLRQKKNEILALNFKGEKQRSQNK